LKNTPADTPKVYQFTTPKGGFSKLTGSLEKSLPAKLRCNYPIILANKRDGLQHGLQPNIAIKFTEKVYLIPDLWVLEPDMEVTGI
jgi:hypothetical protein